MLERLAAVSRNGDGWLWKPESSSALPFHAQEDRRRDELWVSPGSPHGFGASLSGRRKVTCHFQRQVLSSFTSPAKAGAVCNLLAFFFF